MLFRSLLFYAGLALSTALFAPFCVLIYPLPFKQRYYFVTRWTCFNLWWLKITCNLRHEVTGLEHIPDHATLIMCNHQSVWETLALQIIFPPQVWILKRELLWIPIYGWGLASMKPIAIDRGSAIKSARKIVTEGSKRLAQGLSVVIFPEGTRIATDGRRAKYLPGGGMLAQRSGASVIPVAHNAGIFWPKNTLIKNPGVIQMVIGAVIEPANKTATEITHEAECWIRATVSTLPTTGDRRSYS